eukprot:TRINITY_DN493_c0_g1_i2.p1 TRINITY_DN493_c0_g1~~TRINITY_DN493_c0_g1_i2.p1  ORF type:complete len:292 (-),score=92.36 TRINITY_DN493_c0_g1_i2:92-967(-)
MMALNKEVYHLFSIMENTPTEIQKLLLKKDQQIKELEEKIAIAQQENQSIIDNFQTSTDVLLERIKELEATSIGDRPQTANILARIGTLCAYLIEKSRGRRSPKEEEEAQSSFANLPTDNTYLEELKGDEFKEEELKESDEDAPPGFTKCTSCSEFIKVSKMVTHTVACFRNSAKCRACGERIPKNSKAEHLALWKSNDRITKCIAKDDEDELTLILEHGTKLEHKVEDRTLLHLCALSNANDCLLLLISRGADTDPVDAKGCTPLALAIEKGSKKAAVNLIELGAEIECR